MRLRSMFFVLLVLVLTMIMAGGVGKKEPIRIGVNSWPPCEVWTVAQEQGYFGDVPVEITRFSAWADNMTSLYTGKMDITHSSYFNSVYFADKGEKAVMLSPIDWAEGSDGLVMKAEIGNPSNLKGKKIAVEIGTDEHYLLYKALEKYGLRIEDVTLVSIPSYESHKAFIKGDVDAIFTYEPFLSQAANEGKGKIVFTTVDIPGHMVDALMVREVVAKERAADCKIVMAAWHKALQYIKEHPEASYKSMAVQEKMSPADFKSFYESFTFFTEEESKAFMKGETLKALLVEMKSFAVRYKLLSDTAVTEHLLESPILQ